MRTNEPRMPTDEQLMRERFKEWLETEGRYRGHRLNVGHGWDAAWQERDAEVQALREALKSIHDRATRWEVLPTVEAHQSVLQDIGEDALAALAGGETGEAE